MEAWCSGLTCSPVKAEIAGSNPVASARVTFRLTLVKPEEWFEIRSWLHRYGLIVFYEHFLEMVEGKLQHERVEELERRRSLRAYGLADGERVFDVRLASERLGMVGTLDMAIVRRHEVIPVEFKHTEARLGLARFASPRLTPSRATLAKGRHADPSAEELAEGIHADGLSYPLQQAEVLCHAQAGVQVSFERVPVGEAERALTRRPVGNAAVAHIGQRAGLPPEGVLVEGAGRVHHHLLLQHEAVPASLHSGRGWRRWRVHR